MKSKTPKWLKWEFWPTWLFYLPVLFLYFWYSLRARSFLFFSAANPVMEMGGFSDYSKMAPMVHLPDQWKPITLLLPANSSATEVLEQMKSNSLDFPIILKPDRGERGFEVAKIDDVAGLEAYLKKSRHDLMLQEYVDYPLEYGVMYYRLPGDQQGVIDSVVQKGFLSVTGDGIKTIKELCQEHPRAGYYRDHLEKLYQEGLQKVIPSGEEVVLEPIGNHSRGTTFLNANHLINGQLVELFDAISATIQGFNFGRFDLRVKKLEDLYTGHNLKIIEVNGANSEPAHIYDPDMKLAKAYRHLFKHWGNLFRVSVGNHRKGVPYMSFKEGYRRFAHHIRVVNQSEIGKAAPTA